MPGVEPRGLLPEGNLAGRTAPASSPPTRLAPDSSHPLPHLSGTDAVAPRPTYLTAYNPRARGPTVGVCAARTYDPRRSPMPWKLAGRALPRKPFTPRPRRPTRNA